MFARRNFQYFHEYPVLLWLLIKIFVFYANIFSIILLMMITKCCNRRFRTIRERINLAHDDFEQEDYLINIHNDIFWFNICISLIIVYSAVSFVEIFTNNKHTQYEENMLVIFLLRLMYFGYMIKMVFFEKGSLKLNKVLVQSYFVLSVCLSVYSFFIVTHQTVNGEKYSATFQICFKFDSCI
jgi:hypothetical protein